MIIMQGGIIIAGCPELYARMGDRGNNQLREADMSKVCEVCGGCCQLVCAHQSFLLLGCLLVLENRRVELYIGPAPCT